MTDPTLARGVPIDVQRLVESRLLLTANSGAGKSWVLRRILEQTHGSVQQLVIDPEGEFATLREKFDYVIAGKGGDCPAEPRSAALLARKLLELQTSAVLDIYELKAHERHAFVRAFIDALVNAPRALWRPCLVVIDEAHVYAPEKGHSESASAVIDLCTRGRKRGFAALLATQRLAMVAKDAAAQCNNLLIGRAALDVDWKRAGELLGLTKAEARESLVRLKAGEFWCFGPALSDEVRKVKVGAIQTQHPKAGARATRPSPPRGKVKSLLSALADLPQAAEDELRDLEAAKNRVRDLERRLRAAERDAPAPSAEQLEAAREEGRREGHAAVDALERAYGTQAAALLKGVEIATKSLDTMRESLERSIEEDRERPRPAPVASAPMRPAARTNGVTPPVPSAPPPDSDLTGPEQRILDAVVWLEDTGVIDPNQAAVAFVAGYKWGGGAFNNPRGRLRSLGLVEYAEGQRIRSTDAGRALARREGQPLTTEEIHTRVIDRLPGPETRILQPILAAYPESIDFPAVASAAGYEPGGGAFNNPRGRLRTLGLITYPERGRARAADFLFLGDAP